MVKLIIDPGHGGKDPGGGTNKDFKEKDMVLKISKYQLDRFKKLGVNVSLTRTNDKYIDSTPRANIVKNSGADYCISNHINAGGGNGAETIYSIHSDGKLATAILNELKAAGQKVRRAFSKRGKNGDFYFMHRQTGSVETIIVEYGFADTKEDSDRIIKNWKDYAEAVIKSFCENVGVKYSAPGKEATPAPAKPKPKPSVNKQKGVATVIVPSLNLRNKPSTTGKLIRKLSKGEAYKVWEEKNGWLRLGNDMWASWQNGVYMNWTEKPNKVASKPKTPTFKVGSKIKIKSSASKYSRANVTIPAKFKNKSYTIQQVSKNDVLIKELYSWVKKSDLQ